LAFFPDDEAIAADSGGKNSRGAPVALRYAHFDVEAGKDGLPIELGAGAMAVTFRARDTVLDCTVALKVIDRKIATNPIARMRFLREARAAARLYHPNVARVTYYGEQDGECFYAMEFVEGETLEERVRREGPLSPSLALEVALQAARALTAAESCGVVHRDFKPSNLMIASRQGEEETSDALLVKVIDFGVAKLVGAGFDQTQAGFIGTPAYASPEQFDGTEAPNIDTRSDIYSLGVTLWYLLSGRTPFPGRTLEEIRRRQSERLPLDQLQAAKTHPEVAGLLRFMLAVDPADRPQSARELLAAVQRCSEGVQGRAAQTDAEARRGEGFWTAVLPFKFSGDPEIAACAEGLNEEIIAGLSHFPYLRVLARSSTAHYLTESVVPRKVGNELGARYLMEGSLRQAGNKLRIAVRLVDTESGEHLWAETFDRNWQKEKVFELQDEITDRIVGPVADVYGLLARSIFTTTALKAPETLTPHEAVWRFFLAQQRGTAEDHLDASIALERAVELQPGNAAAWAGLAVVYVDEYRHLFNPRPNSLARALFAAERAIDADPASQMANCAFAVTHYFRGDLDAFRAKAENALILNPRCSYTLACLGRLFCYSGEWERGIQLSRRAIELSPHHPGWYHMGIIVNEYRLRRYAEGLAELQLSNKPDYWIMHFLTAVIQAQLGNWPAARAEVERTLLAQPDFTQGFGKAHLQKWFPNQPGLVDQLIEGTKLAGFDFQVENGRRGD
jgi:TolB-like protein/tRNA A-37 threonylcarbamoyl transferase component Bud32